MPVVLQELLWALLIAAVSLPAAYLVATLALSWFHEGYVRVDPVHLRRISLAFSALVFVAAFLLERFN